MKLFRRVFFSCKCDFFSREGGRTTDKMSAKLYSKTHSIVQLKKTFSEVHAPEHLTNAETIKYAPNV